MVAAVPATFIIHAALLLAPTAVLLMVVSQADFLRYIWCEVSPCLCLLAVPFLLTHYGLAGVGLAIAIIVKDGADSAPMAMS